LPEMPIRLALPGSYIVHTYLYLIGGFVDFEEDRKPFTSLLIFDIPAESWVESDICTPIECGLPNCTVLPSSDILIVGGYDPLEIMEMVSKSVFLFDGSNFEKCADLPDEGRLQFVQDALNFRSEIYLFSEDDYLFVYNIDKDSWSFSGLEPEKHSIRAESKNYVDDY
jgi:hypothetical protein